MRIPEVPKILEKLYFAGRPPVLLLGPPGIGKSESVKDAAKAIASRLGFRYVEYDDSVYEELMSNPRRVCVLVDLRLTEVEPADLVGIPRVTQHGATMYIPPAWAKVLSVVECGVLFLDEITNVQRDDVAAVAYKLVLERMAGFVRFSSGVMVVAAGNDPNSSPIARQLPAPLINRLVVLKVSPPTVEEWYRYMVERFGDKFDVRTYMYLLMNSEDLLERPRELDTLTNFATPRSWTLLALLLANGVDSDEVIEGLLGPAVGAKFKAFISTKVDVDRLLREPEYFDELPLDAKYMAIYEVARLIEEGRGGPNVVRFVERLGRHMEWLVLLLKSLRRESVMKILDLMPSEIVNRLYKVATIARAIQR